MFAADVDGDGDIDVLSASRYDDKIAWYENDGSQVFTQRIISTTADGARSASLRRTWTATGTPTCSPRHSPTTRSPGTRTTAARSSRQRIISTAADGAVRSLRRTWTETETPTCSPRRTRTTRSPGTRTTVARSSRSGVISTAADGAFSVFAADVDGDGDTDVLSASFNDDKIAWYENLTAVPEMDVWGNAVSIADGDTTPGMADDTDFGAAFVAGGTVSHTFTIANTLGGDLSLTGMPRVMVNGIHAGDFSVPVQPDSPVIGQSVTTFTVVFDPGG